MWCAARILVLLSLLAGASGADASSPLAATHILHRVGAGETLMDIARDYGLGFVELRAANPGVDAWQPGERRALVIPTLHLTPEAAPEGIVVNLADMRLYVISAEGHLIESFPVGIGREGWETPVGRTEIVRKRPDPVWIPPASLRAENPALPARVPPGPGNPLGTHALSLGWPTYVIHGTNKPDGIGRRVSHGCLRLYPEDIERLFAMVEVGTPVTVVRQPLKLGWIGGELYLEAHPGPEDADRLEEAGALPEQPVAGLRRTIEAYPGVHPADINWKLAEKVARERRGLAIRITQ